MPNRGMLGSPTTTKADPLADVTERRSTITATTRLPTEADTTMPADEFVQQTCAGCHQFHAHLYLLGAIGEVLQHLCGNCLVAQVWKRESERLRIPIEDMPARVAAAQDQRAFRDLMHRVVES